MGWLNKNFWIPYLKVPRQKCSVQTEETNGNSINSEFCPSFEPDSRHSVRVFSLMPATNTAWRIRKALGIVVHHPGNLYRAEPLRQ